MEAGDDRAGRLNGLLNFTTPFAPGNAEEARERLAAFEPEPVPEVAPTPVERAAEPEPNAPLFGWSTAPPEPPLPPVDPFAIIASSRAALAEVGGMTAALTSAARRAGPATGEDRSGSVAVTVAPDGSFERLSFRRPWRRALTPEAFDGAVLEAISNATLARFTGMLPEEGELWPAEPPPLPEFRVVSGLDVDPDLVLEQTDRLVREFLSALAGVRAEPAPPPPGVEVRSETGRVTLTVAGDTVTAVRTHPSWLRTADETRIRAEFESAFAAVNEARPPAGTPPGMNRLNQATDDMRAFARSLGLPF